MLIWVSRRELVSAFGHDFHVVYLWHAHTHTDTQAHTHTAAERYTVQRGVKVQQLILYTFDKSLSSVGVAVAVVVVVARVAIFEFIVS